MAGLTVNRWRRYGKDRLYVNLDDGTRIGWLDLQTGARTLEREALADAFDAAVTSWLAEAGPSLPSDQHEGGHVPGEARETATDTAEEPAGNAPAALDDYAVHIAWRDLRANKPGQAAQAQAESVRSQAPVKTAVARLLGVHTDERAWRIGAAGERKVARELDRLPEGWHVLHALPVGARGADIDHFVVGPGGVFTINAKHHPKARVWVGGNTFLVNGHRQPYIRNSRHEAARAARYLTRGLGEPVGVTGVVAVVNAESFVVKEQSQDVHAIPRRQLRRWLCSQPTVLASDRAARVLAAARRSDTWS